MLWLLGAGCTEDSPQQTAPPPASPTAPLVDREARAADRVSHAQLQFGLERCGDVLDPERLEDPVARPSFVEIVRGCSGLFASRRCRAALDQAEFSREEIAAECTAAYCPVFREDPPPFCVAEMPTDAEFLFAFADFTERVVQRDLRGVLDREGAQEISELLASFIRAQIRQ